MWVTKSRIFHTNSTKPRNPKTEQGNIQPKLIRHKQSTKIRKIREADLKSEAYEMEQA